jgi:hypothetical protein
MSWRPYRAEAERRCRRAGPGGQAGGTRACLRASGPLRHHTFTVATLRDWYRDGVDVQARLPLLSAVLGHVAPAATYWYLTATPDLLALAAQRLHEHLGDLP